MSPHQYLQIHPQDNVLVALKDLHEGLEIKWKDQVITLVENIPAKHKLTIKSFAKGDFITMYGVKVGLCTASIPKGARI
ncbi:MAG: UxaA family hydrolase, partial [Bacteroidota bacterium]